MFDQAETFQKFLLHDVLAGPRIDVPPGLHLDLADAFPDTARLAMMDNKIVDVTSMHPSEKERMVIHMDTTSRFITRLGNTQAERRGQMERRMQSDCGLTPVEDYLIMGVYPKLSPTTLSPSPSEYLIATDQGTYHSLAMGSLQKLADGRQGPDLVELTDKSYREQLSYENSRIAKLIGRVIERARLSKDEWKELRDTAAKSDNYEFIFFMAKLPGAPKEIFAPKSKPADGQAQGQGQSHTP